MEDEDGEADEERCDIAAALRRDGSSEDRPDEEEGNRRFDADGGEVARHVGVVDGVAAGAWNGVENVADQKALRSSIPIEAPMSWATTYMTPRTTVIWFVIIIEKVTAGLMWPPEMPAVPAASRAMARP